jgi:hypothetical protein
LFATTEVAAFLGIGLAAAYLPQILHLSRAHCSAGISRAAFSMWFLAALLVTSHAVATDTRVFIALGLVQILATAVVLVYATRYASSYCAGHEPGPTSGHPREYRGSSKTDPLQAPLGWPRYRPFGSTRRPGLGPGSRAGVASRRNPGGDEAFLIWGVLL